MNCSKNLAITINGGSFPDLSYTSISGNAGTLAAATLNGYDLLVGLPLDGTKLGAGFDLIYTTKVNLPMPGYNISFQVDCTAAAADAGTYRVTINNIKVIVPTLSFPLTCVVNLNAVPQLTYDLSSNSGVDFVDIPIVNGDVLDITLGVDGANPPVDTYEVIATVMKLP